MEFATIPTNLAAKLYNQGVPYQLAAMNVWGVMYVLGNGVEIGGWNDLKGKQIGSTSKGTSADIIFKYLLSQNGLNPDEDVTITYTPSPAEQAQLMIAGRSSVAVLPEPWVSTVLARNKDVKVALDLQQEWTRVNGPDVPFAQTCLVVNRNFAAQHPQIVTEFLKKAAESIDWVNNNNRQAAELIKQQNIGIAPEAAQTAIPRCNLCYMSSLDSRPAVEKYLQVLLAYAPQSVGGKLPDDKFYYKE
jgi:NitT/TauT family transport system substrate-binding protein